MRIWTMLLSLAVVFLVVMKAPAHTAKKHSLRDRFEKMDTNHDGILTQAEYVAAHAKMGAKKATKRYNELATLGGTTTKNDVTGMTFHQFKKAHKEWKEAHSKKSGTT